MKTTVPAIEVMSVSPESGTRKDGLLMHRLPQGPGLDVGLGQRQPQVLRGEPGHLRVDEYAGEPPVVVGGAIRGAGWFSQQPHARDVGEQLAIARTHLSAAFHHRRQPL